VQWVGLYEPAYRLSPEIGRRVHNDPTRRADNRLWLTLDIFPGEDPLAVIEAVRAAGGEIAASLPTLDAHRLHVRIPPGLESELARIRGVQWIEEWGEITLRNNITRWVIQSNVSNVTPLWDNGLHGEGQIVGLIDSRINRDSCFFRDPVNNTPGPDHRKLVAYRSSNGFGAGSHGTHTGGTIAGDQEPINGVITSNGMAYRAKISHANLSDITGFNNTPSNLGQYLALASGDGARVHSNSWGDDGTTAYTTWCRDIDLFSRQFEDDLVAFAVTNLSTLKTPENAKNCLAVAATQQAPLQHQHGTGGRGPTADGRRKPEVYSPGVGIVSASTSACGTTSFTGTSMACPSTTGIGALARQYFETGFYPTGFPIQGDGFVPTGALVKAVLINATVDMDPAGYPTNQEGWGRLLADNTFFFDGDTRELIVFDVRNANGLTTGGIATHQIHVNATSPLKITLVFTDEAAALGAAHTPVNDLDLEVATGGLLSYKGNFFAGGESAQGGAFDPLNNVEMVLLSAPATAEHTIRVYARQVADSPQGYALVVSGDLELPATAFGGPEAAAPARLALMPLRPNPLSSAARLGFVLPVRAATDLAVYDASGRLVRRLVSQVLDAGAHAITWDGLDSAGRLTPSGVYLLELVQPGQLRAVQKATIVR
jgi:hypothetical protein